MAAHDESSLVQVVGYEGSDPARRALAAAGDRRLAFSVPITLARQSSFPVVIVP